MVKKALIAGSIIAGITAASLGGHHLVKDYHLTTGNLLYQEKKVSLESGDIDVPFYGRLPSNGRPRLLPNRCSVYVEWAAQDLFGLKYTSHTAAWNRKYHDTIVKDSVINWDSLEEILEPGHVVGVATPNTPLAKIEDEKGEIASYSHVILYLGRDLKGSMNFAHQFHEEILIETPEGLQEKELVPKIVFSAKK